MLEKIKYINHRGEVLNFGTKDLFVNENDYYKSVATNKK